MNSLEHDLVEVKNLLSDPRNWVKNDFAVNYGSYTCDARADDACRWCVVGAIYKVAQYDDTKAETLERIIKDANHINDLIEYNDGATHLEIMLVLDRAIEYLRESK